MSELDGEALALALSPASRQVGPASPTLSPPLRADWTTMRIDVAGHCSAFLCCSCFLSFHSTACQLASRSLAQFFAKQLQERARQLSVAAEAQEQIEPREDKAGTAAARPSPAPMSAYVGANTHHASQSYFVGWEKPAVQ